MVQRGPGVGEARYLGVREYARLLGVSTATVYKAVAGRDRARQGFERDPDPGPWQLTGLRLAR